MKPKGKILSLLLVICLVAGLMPTAVFAAGTDTGKAIQLGTSGISGYDSAAGYDYIYFGRWPAQEDTHTPSAPIKWRVLDDQANTGEPGLFLLSDALLGTGSNGDVYFDNTNPYSNTWQGSDAQAWCNTFASSNLDSRELAAILETTKSDAAFTSSKYSIPFAASENILNGDKVFFLSAEEAENSAYGFTDDNARIANYGNSAGYWWLRSPNANYTYSAGLVRNIGHVYNYNVNNARAARPAFNLNLNSVLFTSAAAGGKSASGMDSGLAAVGDYDGNEWKLTLLDENRDFSISDAEISGNTVTFSYSGAQTGTNEYISAVIEDNGEITHYGRILQLNGTANGASVKASLTLPDGVTLNDTVKLYVFNEQCNGNYKTDYASAFQDISLAVTLPKEATPQASFTATGDNGGTLSNVEEGMKYSTDGGTSWTNITGITAEITGVTAADDVKIYKPGNGSTTSDSDVQTIDVTQADKPAVSGVNCTTSEQNDGQITDVDNTMEYKLFAASEWTEIMGTKVTGLTNGTYAVRVKASGTVLASEAATVTIGGHTCAAQGDWQHDETNHWNTCECGETINKAEHTFKWVIDTEATATQAGSRHEECTVCGYKKDAVEIPATGTTGDPSQPTEKPDATTPTDKEEPSGTNEAPPTGDNSNYLLWIILALTSSAGLTGTVIYRRRKKQNR